MNFLFGVAVLDLLLPLPISRYLIAQIFFDIYWETQLYPSLIMNLKIAIVCCATVCLMEPTISGIYFRKYCKCHSTKQKSFAAVQKSVNKDALAAFTMLVHIISKPGIFNDRDVYKMAMEEFIVMHDMIVKLPRDV